MNRTIKHYYKKIIASLLIVATLCSSISFPLNAATIDNRGRLINPSPEKIITVKKSVTIKDFSISNIKKNSATVKFTFCIPENYISEGYKLFISKKSNLTYSKLKEFDFEDSTKDIVAWSTGKDFGSDDKKTERLTLKNDNFDGDKLKSGTKYYVYLIISGYERLTDGSVEERDLETIRSTSFTTKSNN